MGTINNVRNTLQIGLVGDFNADVPAHQAIPLALAMAAETVHVPVSFEWLPTPQIGSGARLGEFGGLWCVPASPYLDMQGALTAIRFARERLIPFLGTCGGFQHALVEYARNQLGWADAEHGETAPQAANVIIEPLSCSLVESVAAIHLQPDTLIAQAYGTLNIEERYHCRYGLRRELEPALFGDALKVSGRGPEGEVRSIELQGHPFFVATLFQPERAALQGKVSPVVAAFVRACSQAAQRNRS
ncbi:MULTISPECIES: CTP synthase [Pseudomonas syringae group]|uniref:CTP synthase C-terminal region-related (seleno)protein n=1 Tax=Pseudomonas syringae group TaxID=136849 RepID=UPI001E38C164|nr:MULTISPECIES: CTP synthase [Pseudomonas syringae group]MDU8546028.1 CTP synthase [Pseudomonas syringae group sp. J248-6]UFI43220.1 CTP synthase [Pseudomonas savastanoi]